MRHPFHGIIGPESDPQVSPALSPSRPVGRRGFFGQSLAALGGLGAWFFTRAAPAQTPFNSRGTGFPEGGALQGGFGGGLNSAPSGGPVTTFALGEEGGGGTVTTFALGEEGGGPYPRRRRRWNGGQVTTFALGEEGGSFPPRRYTTFALGEEGGGFNDRRW